MHNLKISTVIIEKDTMELDHLSSCLKKTDCFLILGATTDYKKGISLVSNYAPNLIFVNVSLKGASGLELISTLQNRNIFTEVVFTADNADLAYQSLELKPLDYLPKPIVEENIRQLLLRLNSRTKKRELIRKMDAFTSVNQVKNVRTFKQKGGIVILSIKDIIYCKAELTKTILHLIKGEKFELKSGLKKILETINCENFIKVGRSYCINKKFIRKVDKKNKKCYLYHEGQTWVIPISKSVIEQLEKLNTSPIV